MKRADAYVRSFALPRQLVLLGALCFLQGSPLFGCHLVPTLATFTTLSTLAALAALSFTAFAALAHRAGAPSMQVLVFTLVVDREHTYAASGCPGPNSNESLTHEVPDSLSMRRHGLAQLSVCCQHLQRGCLNRGRKSRGRNHPGGRKRQGRNLSGRIAGASHAVSIVDGGGSRLRGSRYYWGRWTPDQLLPCRPSLSAVTDDTAS